MQEPVEPVVVKSEKEKKRPSDFEEPDWILAEFETDGKPNVPNRALSSASYLLPLLDGLHYGRYFFMQVQHPFTARFSLPGSQYIRIMCPLT
jgi:hypothetical protein